MTHINLEVDFPGIIPPLVDIKTGRLTDSWFQFLYTLWLRTGESAGDSVVPTGVLMAWTAASTEIPTGWLLCDGSAVSRTVYSTLFDTIGTTWGAGDGSTTFNLPDGQDRVLLGASATKALASSGGAETATLALANLASHGHTVTVTDPGHSHAVTDPQHNHTSLVAASNVTAGAAAGGATAGNTGSSSTSVTVDSGATGITAAADAAGSGTPFDILPPYRALHFIIKT